MFCDFSISSKHFICAIRFSHVIHLSLLHSVFRQISHSPSSSGTSWIISFLKFFKIVFSLYIFGLFITGPYFESDTLTIIALPIHAWCLWPRQPGSVTVVCGAIIRPQGIFKPFRLNSFTSAFPYLSDDGLLNFWHCKIRVRFLQIISLLIIALESLPRMNLSWHAVRQVMHIAPRHECRS